MSKSISLFFVFIFFTTLLFAQKRFDITIRLDSSINPQSVHYQYYNGKNLTFVPDTFGNVRTVNLKGEYFSPLVSVNISYSDPSKTYYGNDFFINDKPALINLYFKPNKENMLNYRTAANAYRIYDTTSNEVWRKLKSFTMNESDSLVLFFDRNKKGFQGNDSLTRVFNRIYKGMHQRAMLFLKDYPDDYFSFWYFYQQVAKPSFDYFKNDTAYLKSQLAYVKSVFPPKFTESIEGKEIIKTYEAIINPLKINENVPAFSVTTLDGKKISLSVFKGKYVLLDFWATWCAPCMAELPFIKEIRKSNDPDKFVIIGISQDRDIRKLIATVKKESMDWLHFHDLNGEISRLYGVGRFPTLILLNKDGKMIYESDLETEDKDALPKVLARLDKL